MKIFPIHDVTSVYLDQTKDEGASQAVRELLSRRSRSAIQDQVVVLWRDMADFASGEKATSYDTNVRWLASRPWVRVVTAKQIIDGQIAYKSQDGNTYSNWSTVGRGTGQDLVQTAKDWVDHATQESYDNWYYGSAFEQGLSGRTFGAVEAFGRVGDSGHADAAWSAISGLAPGSDLRSLGEAAFGGAMFQTAFHNTTNHDLGKFSTGDYIYPDTSSGQTLADFARIAQSQARFSAVVARVQQWATAAAAGTIAAPASATEDVDLDGESEYLLYNDRLFGLFGRLGGRMTAAWTRDIDTGKVLQVIGNPAGYAGSDSEEEGAVNVTGSAAGAYRTSAFKDWFAQTGGPGVGTDSYVNDLYEAAPAATGTGWTFSSSDAKIAKTITMAARSTQFEVRYALSGDVNKVYIRFGLSPDLMDLLMHGQSHLSGVSADAKDVNLVNDSPAALSRAYVRIAGGTHAGATWNAAAVDDNPGGGVDFNTVAMRNQAQTQQVEIEGGNNMAFALGFQTGATVSLDSDGDGLPDWWEELYGLDPNDDGTSDVGNGASGDGDGDGLSNADEFLLGSDPTTPNAFVPEIESNPDGSVTLSFASLRDRAYTIEVADSLLGTWQGVETLDGNGGILTWTDIGDPPARPHPSAVPNRFYRVTGTPVETNP
jgi:hypothetical protein